MAADNIPEHHTGLVVHHGGEDEALACPWLITTLQLWKL